MITRAAVCWEAGAPLALEDVTLDPPHDDEVLVELRVAGVCHTDAFTLSGRDAEGRFPSILGHEGAGIVLETGRNVSSLRPGDHVVPLYTPECRACPSCLSRKTNLCTALRATQGLGLMPDGTSRFHLGDTALYHYMGCSTFARHTVLPEIALAKIRPDAPWDAACLLGCGVTAGIGAALWVAKVEPGATVIVFGLGQIGLNVVQGARLAGATRIIGVARSDVRKSLAISLGVNDFVNTSTLTMPLIPHLLALTDGGADYTFECVGDVTVMRQALETARRGWGVATIIGVAPSGAEVSTRPFQLVTGRTWKGSAFGGARGRTDLPKLLDWYMAGRIEVDRLISHRLPHERINDAFALLASGTSLRTLIEYP